MSNMWVHEYGKPKKLYTTNMDHCFKMEGAKWSNQENASTFHLKAMISFFFGLNFLQFHLFHLTSFSSIV